jgi:hypothetical protein
MPASFSRIGAPPASPTNSSAPPEKISSNIAEGYSRATGRARALFYDYALGSARETRDWYYKGRRAFGPKTTDHRLELSTSITRLLLTMVSNERRNDRRLDPD